MIYNRQHSVSVTRNDYIEQFGSIEQAKLCCFNIGAGTWQHEAWTNIDLPPQSEDFAKIQAPCIYHDLVASDNLPISPGSAELIFTSHVIEHLPDAHVKNLFHSAAESLKKGGLFRVVTGPDADTDWDALSRQDSRWWYFFDDLEISDAIAKHGPLKSLDKWLYHLATPRSPYSKTPCEQKYYSHQLEELIEKYKPEPMLIWDELTSGLEFNLDFPGDHLSWWNADKLSSCLSDCGFSRVKVSAYGQSSSVFMRDLEYFDTTYPQISLYVEAIK